MSVMAPALVEIEDCPQCLLGNLNWLLAQAHYSLASQLATAFEPLNITPRGHSVLAAAMTGTHTQKELAELVGLDKTTMVVTLDELEGEGLAKRVPSSTDRRAHVVEVTAAGRAKVTSANEIVARVQADVLASLDPHESEALLRTLGQLVRERLAEPAACKGVRRREPRGHGA
ncbi:MAG: MarR family transcriptional regulator, transcriptional regulator for hemolysin [Solirubrobacteraceae bacterium]|jgi:DNA-binding MarR family transcriptional regulator|nr:MarR family transcriptional regulator, transcriptional regulator for hemolysin [Solirubrobacteraceae bacterium]